LTTLRNFIVNFRIGSYKHKHQVQIGAELDISSSGSEWSLLTYEELKLYRPIFDDYYTSTGGLYPIHSWASSGCCVSGGVEGFRLTADGKSFVYPMSSAPGPGPGAVVCAKAGEGGVRFYESLKYKLAYFDKGNDMWLDISHATELYAASAAGSLCGAQQGEQNPGIFIRRTPISKEATAQNPTCRTFPATSERLCVDPEAS
jgi:hypothetical protein